MPTSTSFSLPKSNFEIEYDSIDEIYYVVEKVRVKFATDSNADYQTPFKFESYLDDIIQTVGWY